MASSLQVTVDTTDPKEVLNHPLVKGLLENISDGALVIDAKGRQILAMNANARELLGYKEEEVIGCQCRRMMNSPACTLSCPLTAMLEGRKEQAKQKLFYRGQDGEQMLHAETRMLLVQDPSGEPLVGIELFTDLREVRALKKALQERRGLEGIVGGSSVMQELYTQIEQIAPYDIPVLILGESGVGKERIADAIQSLSHRSEKPFVKVNCAALSPALIESELFGHRRGAFTGADRDHQGHFETADGGTLLLDEVGELPMELQAKLMRILQEGELQRVGCSQKRTIDVRVLASTNRILEEDVAKNRFRQDLYYRLLGARIQVPSLRQRREDIPLLAEHFVRRFVEQEQTKHGPGTPMTFAPKTMKVLVEREWTGNIRELEHIIQLAAIRTRPAQTIQPNAIELPWQANAVTTSLPILSLAELERNAIEQAMTESQGNISAAARLLDIDRTTLWRKLKKLC